MVGDQLSEAKGVAANISDAEMHHYPRGSSGSHAAAQQPKTPTQAGAFPPCSQRLALQSETLCTAAAK